MPYWVYAALASTFCTVGLAVVVVNRRDLRAAWLGGMFILLGAPLAATLLLSATGLYFVRPEAFTASFLWHFIALFPHRLEGRAGRFIRAVATFAAVVGVAMFVVVLVSAWTGFRASALRIHWSLSMGLSAAAFPVLLWRAARAEGDARRRARIFAQGLLLGVAPVSLEVLLEELWRPYHDFVHRPGVEPVVGTIIFGALAIVPFVTAYAVLYDRVVEIRVVLRAAIQYALARYTIIVATLVPFGALAVFVFTHRDEPIAALMTGRRPIALVSFGLLGLVALNLRGTWLARLDRRYFRDAYDAQLLVTRVVGSVANDSPGEVVQRLRDAIGQALHADVEIFLVDDKRTALRHVDDRLPPLSLRGTLAGLALGDQRPMEVDLENPGSTFRRLPATEQRWLSQGQFQLLVPLKAAGGAATGMLALTAKRSGLSYSAEEHRLLSTLGAATGLVLDSLRLRSTPDSSSGPAARECVACSRITSPEATQCGCGGHVVDAAMPYMLRGVFRLEQRIGAGGMGVVYRAVDVDLRREVAIKTLPHVTPARVARMRREARAMAAVVHPNLAVIHGIEMWHDTPLLVQEYWPAARWPPASPHTAHRSSRFWKSARRSRNFCATCMETASSIATSSRATSASRARYRQAVRFRLAHARRVSAGQSPRIGLTGTAAERTGAIVGTPHFMSPEAVRGQQAAPAVDFWALSVVLYYALTEAYPFAGPDAAAICSRILEGRADPWCGPAGSSARVRPGFHASIRLSSGRASSGRRGPRPRSLPFTNPMRVS